jgi:type II secretory pathway component GspD/PulD (secretin)
MRARKSSTIFLCQLGSNMSKCNKKLLLLMVIFVLTGCSSFHSKETRSKLKFDSLINEQQKQQVCKPKKMVKMRRLSLDNSPHYLSKKRYSFQFLDQSIREALLELSTSTNVPIVFDENVSGLVSVNIQKKNFIKSLDMIVSSGPYDYKYKDGYYYVGVLDPKSSSWSRLSYFYTYKTKSLRPSSILKQINSKYLALISSDDSRNTISINAPRKLLLALATQIHEVDVPRKQVQLNLSIAEISSKGKEYLGSLLNSTLAGGTIKQLATLGTDQLKGLLYAMNVLRTNGELDVKARPSILVLEGNVAKFSSSIKKILPPSTAGGKVQFMNAGIDVEIQPRIGENNEVVLTIKNLKLGDITKDEINEHGLTTSIRIKEGESILIGGMLKEKRVVQITKVPLLGDIPLIGYFFKSKREVQELVEVIFLIRPVILCGS